MESNRVPKWAWAVLVLAHVLALGWALRTQGWKFPDSDRYQQAADNLRDHGVLYARPWPTAAPTGKDVQEFTIRPPGYPVVVILLGGLATRPVALLLLQNMLSLLNIGVVLRWWGQRTRSSRGQWGGGLLLALSFPGQLIYANALMSELLLQTAVLVMAGMALLLIATRRARFLVGICVAVALALLIKPVFYPLAGLVAAAGGWLAWRWRRPLLGVVGVAPALVVVLYMGWNLQRTGLFHFSSIAEINLLHYNAAGVVRALDGAEAEERWVASVLRAADAQPSFGQRQAIIQQMAARVLWTHPLVYARQHLQGMAALFVDPGRFDISEFLKLEPPKNGGFLAQIRAGGFGWALGQLPVALLVGLIGIALANVVRLGLAVRGFRQLKSSGPTLCAGRWVLVGLILYVAVLTGPLGAARFLVPVWPLLLALALVGWRPLAGRVVSGPEQGARVGESQR